MTEFHIYILSYRFVLVEACLNVYTVQVCRWPAMRIGVDGGGGGGDGGLNGRA